MSALFGEQVTLGQANGPEIELVVFGDERYARYETLDGYSVVYDEDAGLFVYAGLEEGAFVPGGTPASDPPPAGAVLHGRESAAARQARIRASGSRRARRRSEPPPPESPSNGERDERDLRRNPDVRPG